jgi:peroxiredoxin
MAQHCRRRRRGPVAAAHSTKGDPSNMVSFGRTSVADRTQTLKVGDQAPDFELPGHRNGEKFKLSDLRGKKNAVLVFYPLDWTPV